MKFFSIVVVSIFILAAQPLNKELFAQQLQPLLNDVKITFYSKKIKIVDSEKGLTKTIYDSKDTFTRLQKIEFSDDNCSLSIKISNSSFKIKLADIIDIVFIKNKSPTLAPETYPIFIKTKKLDTKHIIYARKKDKQALKSLKYLSYLCQKQQSEI